MDYSVLIINKQNIATKTRQILKFLVAIIGVMKVYPNKGVATRKIVFSQFTLDAGKYSDINSLEQRKRLTIWVFFPKIMPDFQAVSSSACCDSLNFFFLSNSERCYISCTCLVNFIDDTLSQSAL